MTGMMGNLYSGVPLADLITARRMLVTLNRANAAISRGQLRPPSASMRNRGAVPLGRFIGSSG